jgi:hypothetical protein
MNVRHRIAIVTAGLLIASSGAKAGAPPDPTIDACTLVTKAEAEQTIGKLKGTPTSSVIERVRMCEYPLADGTDGLSLWVLPVSGMDRARKEYQDLKPVKGVGEEAFVHTNSRFGKTEFFVRQGNATLRLALDASKDSEAKVLALARKAVARLK